MAGKVLTTEVGAERLGGDAVGLAAWDSIEVPRPSGAAVVVTAVPAQHGPEGSEEVMGPVIGFVLSGPGLPRIYLSGDNASVEVVRTIAQRQGPIDVAVLFTGGASIASRFDGAYLTLSNDRAVEAARVLGAARIVPAHFDGWAHFSENGANLRRAFADAGIADRLAYLEPGQSGVVA